MGNQAWKRLRDRPSAREPYRSAARSAADVTPGES